MIAGWCIHLLKCEEPSELPWLECKEPHAAQAQHDPYTISVLPKNATIEVCAMLLFFSELLT